MEFTRGAHVHLLAVIEGTAATVEALRGVRFEGRKFRVVRAEVRAPHVLLGGEVDLAALFGGAAHVARAGLVGLVAEVVEGGNLAEGASLLVVQGGAIDRDIQMRLEIEASLGGLEGRRFGGWARRWAQLNRCTLGLGVMGALDLLEGPCDCFLPCSELGNDGTLNDGGLQMR